MLDWLKNHIKSTDISKIKEEWEEIENQFPIGVKALDYLEYTKVTNPNYNVKPKLLTYEAIVSTNLTSNFSGSFFLCNIAQ